MTDLSDLLLESAGDQQAKGLRRNADAFRIAASGVKSLETEVLRLSAEVQSAFFAGCDYGSTYAGDQYLGTPERQRGFDQWKHEIHSRKRTE